MASLYEHPHNHFPTQLVPDHPDRNMGRIEDLDVMINAIQYQLDDNNAENHHQKCVDLASSGNRASRRV